MLNRKVKVILVSLALSLAVTVFTSGCGFLKKDDVTETEAQTQTETETETETESETETETETETELQKDIAYTSQDKTIRITLPDSTWKVKQDVDEMRVFSSGSDAMISIVHAANESAMKNITVYESEDALKAGMTKQYQEANSFEVVEFEKMSTATLNTYEYVVKYNATSMWAYSITYGIMAEDEAYVISGTVTDDNRVLMEAVKEAVESFTVLRNAAFNAIPGTVVDMNESESESEADTQGELKSLVDYGTTATLYVSADIVNIREQPSTEATIIGSLGEGDAVTVVGETAQWFKINILGNIGYVSKAFLVNTAPNKQTEETSASGGSNSQEVSDSTKISAEMNSYVDYGASYTYYTTTTVNLRSQPGTESSILSEVNGDTAVSVIGETSNWFVVSVNGATGYISKSYLSSTNTSGSTGDSGSAGGSNEGESSSGGTTSGTGTLSGTIQSVSADTIVILGDDGNNYTLNYADASVSSTDGIYEGIYIVASVDYSKSSGGTYYAMAVNGY